MVNNPWRLFSVGNLKKELLMEEKIPEVPASIDIIQARDHASFFM
jgi:hypothetical protein